MKKQLRTKTTASIVPAANNSTTTTSAMNSLLVLTVKASTVLVTTLASVTTAFCLTTKTTTCPTLTSSSSRSSLSPTVRYAVCRSSQQHQPQHQQHHRQYRPFQQQHSIGGGRGRGGSRSSGNSSPRCEDVIQRRSFRSSSSSLVTLQSSAVSTNDDLVPGIAAIDDVNDDIRSKMMALRDAPYFRMFAIDILASCEYLPQELFECYSELCEVYPVDDELVPGGIRDTDLMECDLEIDGWARWDMPSNDYYDTDEFPEGYTGYDGSEVWNYIHDKICFGGYGYDGGHWKADFNKAVSGVHSVISAQVARGIQEKIDSGEEFTPEEVWRDPKTEFDRRLSVNGETPGAMENLYFTYMLVLSAVAKAKDKFMADCATGRIDPESAKLLQEFLSHPILSSPDVWAPSTKLRDYALQSTSDLWEARMRSRELLRIINCVQCNKCRLHGKVSMMG
eukprot:CAMPEP_0113490576 /NCGR_PEP_ID=MMETSP0014_2-20120614/27118_1 /TAXON_ID=2857 /ORGANISM="Nitzschia sp." /LENGTH=449 /DNA_ID=CAMNT_0000384353 /DNA_START=70 /DNA_END=1415 /DNA_ORIENTATION=- /assembly_acc=CAM_ASM_000159